MFTKTIRRTLDYASLAKSSLQLRWSHSDKSREAAQRLVAQRLGKLRGLPQKVGQMMAFSADEARRDAFGALFEDAQPLPWNSVRPILEAAWSIDAETLFKRIDSHGRAASLGQVHSAEYEDGRKVAIKIQYPGIRNAVMSDLRGLGWLASPFGNLNRGFDLTAYRETILAGLEEELDYRCEAKNQTSFAAGPGRCPFVVVPRVDQELSTENILVTDWIDGDSWETVLRTWNTAEKQELGKRLLKWFLQCIFEYGQVHADLHPGNIRFVRSPEGIQIVLYDFGSVYRMSQAERMMLLRLIDDTRELGVSSLALLAGLGFDAELLKPLSDRLSDVCRIMLEPFCVARPYDLTRWRLSERLNALLGDDRMNLRIAGPPRLLFLLRAFHNVVTYLKGLDAKVSWSQQIESHLIQNRRGMNTISLPRVEEKDTSVRASHLKVRVRRGGELKACVTLPAGAIDRLHCLLDPETLNRIEQEQIDLAEIVRDLQRNNYAPGTVFELADTQRDVKVWLE